MSGVACDRDNTLHKIQQCHLISLDWQANGTQGSFHCQWGNLAKSKNVSIALSISREIPKNGNLKCVFECWWGLLDFGETIPDVEVVNTDQRLAGKMTCHQYRTEATLNDTCKALAHQTALDSWRTVWILPSSNMPRWRDCLISSFSKSYNERHRGEWLDTSDNISSTTRL